MNTILWNEVLAYDFDQPLSEYGFSTRLAKENYWTQAFTQKAILEYKKFMYLAATHDAMVSPSEIVDVVWHQHLVFTQSYADFGKLLGKVVQHIPSTHNRQDAARFKQAKERTHQLYKNNFGEPPSDVWEYATMQGALQLPKAKYKSSEFTNLFYLNFGVLAFALSLGMVRLAMGLMRDKPVAQLVFFLVIIGFVMMYRLWRLTTAITEQVIPKFYRAHIVPAQQKNTNPDWQYFLMGTAALTPVLLPIVRRHNADNNSSSDSSSSDSSSSDSSGCGSSCSSCGGCGGD